MTDASEPRPAPVARLAGAVQIAVGANHSCALLRDGSAWCWGQLVVGEEETRDLPAPTPIVGASELVELAAGDLHTCGRRADGAVLCWGLGVQGQLGDGTSESHGDATLATTVSAELR